MQLEVVQDASLDNEIRLDLVVPPMNVEASGSQQEPISQIVTKEVQVPSNEPIP